MIELQSYLKLMIVAIVRVCSPGDNPLTGYEVSEVAGYNY